MPEHVGPFAFMKSSISAWAAALEAEACKRTKYSGLLHTYSFAPVAVETLGVWGAEAEDLTEELGRRMVEVTKERHSKFFSVTGNRRSHPERQRHFHFGHIPRWAFSVGCVLRIECGILLVHALSSHKRPMPYDCVFAQYSPAFPF